MLPVIFMPAARAELLEARDWCTTRNMALTVRFTEEVERTVHRIAASPRQFPVVYRDVRRARCRRFPYGLFFRIVAEAIYIIACFHSSRDPRLWQRRT